MEANVQTVFSTALEHTRHFETFALTKYRLYAQAVNPIFIHGYKGSAFHGGFGHALKCISPSIFQTVFQPPFPGDPPKPYVITPPLDAKPIYQIGDMFHFDLLLMGSAVQHFPICFAALEYLGEQLGIGKEKAKFKIVKIDYADHQNVWRPVYENNQWQFIDTVVSAAQLMRSTQQTTANHLTLKFHSFLRLKNDSKLVATAPAFSLLMDRLLGRICSLSKYYNNNCLLVDRSEREQYIQHANRITTTANHLQWQDWTRYSGRQKTTMKFGGLMGTIQYQGDFAPCYPFLKLGEWLHIGGKTSFGLGGYEMVS